MEQFVCSGSKPEGRLHRGRRLAQGSVFQRGRFQGRTHITVKTIKATKWAPVQQIEEAIARWPRSTPDAVWVRQIMAETGLSERMAIDCLHISRGGEGDCITVDE